MLTWLRWRWLVFKWWFQWDRAARDLQIRMTQECWPQMPLAKWHAFIDRLPTSEFLVLIAQNLDDGPDAREDTPA